MASTAKKQLGSIIIRDVFPHLQEPIAGEELGVLERSDHEVAQCRLDVVQSTNGVKRDVDGACLYHVRTDALLKLVILPGHAEKR